mgnify:FL=1
MRTTDLSMVIALAMLTPAFTAAAEPSARMLAYSCAGCHGTDGSSVGLSNPHLAGMNKEYFIESMQDYKLDRRNPTIMNRLAKAYTDKQIAGMADFFAAQPLRLLSQEHDASQVELGARYHQRYCEKCHEEGGRGDSDGGILAGQWALYLRYTMADYKSGARLITRKMRKKLEKMEEMEQAHGDAAVEALIHFYASQK